VAPAIEPGLFRPFDQLHLLRAPGLGLSIVQRLVSLQGGRCGYERLNDGSNRFYFTLPAPAISSSIAAPLPEIAVSAPRPPALSAVVAPTHAAR